APLDADPPLPLGAFGPASALVTVNTDLYLEENPTVTADGLELYFDSDRPGGTGLRDIWVSRRASVDEAWGAPEPVGALNSSDDDNDPEVSADGLVIHVSSLRAGGQGSYDIWTATRPDRASAWSAPIVETALNSPARD